MQSPPARWLRRTLVASLVFAILMTWLSIRDNPIIIGYYYGSDIAVFLALLVSLAVAALAELGGGLRLVGTIVALGIVLVQLNNFFFVNERWRTLHVETAIRPAVEKQFKVSQDEASWSELGKIWSVWKAGGLEAYLSDHAIPPAASYLIYELRAIDQFRPRRPS